MGVGRWRTSSGSSPTTDCSPGCTLSTTAGLSRGATALLARKVAVRHTIDIDVYRATGGDQAEREVRAAARSDLGDGVSFDIGPATPVVVSGSGTRLPVLASIGATPWARFHIDVVAEGVRMTGIPDDVPPLIPDLVPGLDQPRYRVYPLVDHIAATLARYGDAGRPSTRYMNLVDLVALVGQAMVTAREQCRALDSEAEPRGLVLPPSFDVPDAAQWRLGYAAEARRAVGTPAPTLEAALAVVRPFIQPLLYVRPPALGNQGRIAGGSDLTPAWSDPQVTGLRASR
jgi:hypothetical protein